MSSASDQRDAEDLARLGYAQQLLRQMGGFSNFALSFSIISVLTGAVTLYGHGLAYGGPIVMSVGWPLVTVMTLFVAASLAELASAYPTAGALYHWSSILGGPGAGFFTAWLNTIGQFAITAGIDYGLAEFVVAMLELKGGRGTMLGVYAAILGSHAALNHVGVRAVSLLNMISAWYHIAGVLLLVAVLGVVAPLKPASFLLEHHVTTPQPFAYVFCIGLLQAQWTFTGYDASAHVTEETRDPRRNAPWGIVLSVAVSGVAGYLMLLVITLAIRDLDAAAGAKNAFIYVLRHAVGRSLGNTLTWMVMGAIWFCGLSSVTSNSRMLFAFARDGGLPASSALASVSRFRTPAVAVWTSAVMAFVVALWAEAYSAVVALSTIALYASYALPILVGLRARLRGDWTERGPWHLGRWSSAINVIALAWVFVITVLFVLPPNELAGYAFFACLLALTFYWASYMRTRFSGPRVGFTRSTASPTS